MRTIEGPACLPAAPSKIDRRHLDRSAMVYVRQSTHQQVLEHRESAALQYGLRCRAIEWGWPPDRVITIDQDQGRSGASAVGRAGFQRLLAEIGLDHVGLVLGIEMSRLARSNRDWHQLLELCAIFGVLLADQEGMYDPQQYNDRLLLGLKGTISEAELHLIRQRSWNGQVNKARRGQLNNHPPVGYVCDADGELELDPDEEVQAVVRLIFAKFEEIGSVNGVLKYLVENGIKIPIRSQFRANKGELKPHRPNLVQLSNMFHHALYAGAYCWARRPTDPKRKATGRAGSRRQLLAPEDCRVFLKDRHPAYISWEQYQRNVQRLQENRSRIDARGAARGGGSLLSGLVVCAKCGRRLRVSYSGPNHPRYTCSNARTQYGLPACQSFAGRLLEQLLERQILRVLEPAAVELSLAAANDLEREQQTLDKHWRLRLERARHATNRAARQYHAVEPENRLVARELERRWEQCMREQQGIEEEHERFREQHPAGLTDVQRDQIRALATDIPALWRSAPCTPQDRQEITRHLVDKIVVDTSANSPILDVALHFAGGFVSHHELRRPMGRWDQMSEYPELLQRVKTLANGQRTAGQIAEALNQDNWHPPRRKTFNVPMVQALVERIGLQGKRPGRRRDDLLQRHESWLGDLARKLDVPQPTLHNWRKRGWVHGRQLKGPQGRWILWADESELKRLRSLRSCARGWYNQPMSETLTTPKRRQGDS